jgi:hypothetical protein
VATLEVQMKDSKNCLPQNLLSLIRPPVDSQGDVVFYNGGDSTLSFSWRPKTNMETESDWKDLHIKPGEVERVSLCEK